MARGRRSNGKRQRGFFNFRRRVLLVFFCVLGVVSGGWYLVQPAESKGEVRRILCTWGRHHDKINLLEVVGDVLSINAPDAPSVDLVPDAKEPLGGFPLATRQLLLLSNEGYYVGYDEENRSPAWVAYRLFDCGKESAGERPEAFLPDTRVAKPVKSEDYTGTGYDRGHLAPNSAIGRCYGAKAQNETFVLSNVVPQKHHFNAGIWKSLESREINNYSLRYGEIWVITGPVFGSRLHYTETGLMIPDKLFKIIACYRGGKIYAISFLMGQDAEGKFSTYLCSIDDIEKLAQLDIFPKLTTEQQQILEAAPAQRPW